MYRNKKIILFAFASKDLIRSAKRLKNQALQSKYYDDIKIYSPENFDKQMSLKFEIITKNKNKRGYGYWFWKPLFLLKVLNDTDKDDIIHYVDIGCHLQNKNSRFKEYLDILIDSKKWILPFQYYVDYNKFSREILFPNRDEYKFTKADLLNYFGFLNDKRITHSPQFWSGSFFLNNELKAKSFLLEWSKIFDENIDFINDTPSIIENLDGFVENRHDQSVFSLLCKKYNVESISAYECEWGQQNNQRTWVHNINNPILAKRDLKYNIFRRFINRQLKTFKRLRKKYIDNK